MKSLLWKLCLLAGVSCALLFGKATTPCRADENPGGQDECLQRLERRINELSELQGQMTRRVGAPQGPQQPMMNQPGVPQRGQGRRPSVGPENMQPQMASTGLRPPVEGKLRHDVYGAMRLVVLVWIVCNILLATWIFTDIRMRGEGAGIFIALALVAGIPAAIIYSLVRIGDRASGVGK